MADSPAASRTGASGESRTSRFTAGAGSLGPGDIIYNTQENGPSNTYNGFFSVESDEYELFLNGTLLGGFQLEKSPMTGEQAGHSLWEDLIARAGIERA